MLPCILKFRITWTSSEPAPFSSVDCTLPSFLWANVRNWGLCWSEGAPIIHIDDKYPFENPKSSMMRKNMKLEFITGGLSSGAEPGLWILHIKKRGTNIVRARDINNSLLAFQTRNTGNAQAYRPKKSPILNRRKWMALKSKGWMVLESTGWTEVVIGGKTACGKDHGH